MKERTAHLLTGKSSVCLLLTISNENGFRVDLLNGLDELNIKQRSMMVIDPYLFSEQWLINV